MERRIFLAASGAASLAAGPETKPAALGGEPVRKAPFPSWPIWSPDEEKALLAVLRKGRWNRGSMAEQFESAYARLTGATGCLATANGTSALLTTLSVLGIQPGDEVLVPPYTFVATINVVLQLGALPVFVDTDRETFQIDARKIEAAITPRTRAILPVHLGGNVADLDTILALASKRGIPVVEDACQAHLAEWRGRKAGSLGVAGCFSFQASKNLNSGEGGAIVSSDTGLLDRAWAYHNNGRGRRTASLSFTYEAQGLNLRITEFQAALLLAQLQRLEEQAKRREANAAHLTALLQEIPGIHPARQYGGCTRNAYHLYMFRYDPSSFAGLPRAGFLRALRAEGIPSSSGYEPLQREAFIRKALSRFYSAPQIAAWEARTHCPANDQLCKEAVWFTQTMLLGERKDMEDIARAIGKIRAAADQLAKA